MAQKSTETSMQMNPVAQCYHQAATAEERLLEEGEFKTKILMIMIARSRFTVILLDHFYL